MYKGLLNQYASYLPVNENTPDVSLMEGNTPLIPLLNISKQLGIQLYGKYEGANPTGSFKDRWYGNGSCEGERRRFRGHYLCVNR